MADGSACPGSGNSFTYLSTKVGIGICCRLRRKATSLAKITVTFLTKKIVGCN
jgi:hypothetical protein